MHAKVDLRFVLEMIWRDKLVRSPLAPTRWTGEPTVGGRAYLLKIAGKLVYAKVYYATGGEPEDSLFA